MEASIIACDQQIIDGVLILNNLTVSIMSDSPLARFAFFIQTNDSNNTFYRFNFPDEIFYIQPSIRYSIRLTDYMSFDIRSPKVRGALKYQIYIRNMNGNQAYISCPLLDGEYFEVRA